MNDNHKNYVNLETTKTFVQKHLHGPNKWRYGTDKDESQKILWWCCDTLFRAPPMLTLYANHTGDTRYLDSMLTLYIEIYDLLYKKEEHLFSQDTSHQWEGNIKDLKEDNKIFWSRDN
jgi:unsaturated rhamnogalacturonyl hydrolase